MRLANTADEYGLISKLFHWSMALLMIAVYFLGKNLENNYQYYYEILIVHNTLGLLILLLAIFRLSWKWINIRPKLLVSNKILVYAAKTTYFLFYFIFFLQPISGYLVTNLQGDTVIFFNIELASIIDVDSDLRFIFRLIHESVSYTHLTLPTISSV